MVYSAQFALSSPSSKSSSSSSSSSSLPSGSARVMTSSTMQCPVGCHCYLNNTSTTCISASLTWIPSLPLSTNRLVMRHNNLNRIHNYSFYGLSKMEHLDLDNNNILSLAAEALFGLFELRILKLGNNNIAQLPRDVFRDNIYLEEIDLHGNYFSIIPHLSLTNLASLKVLNLSINHISDPMLGTGFKQTTRLKTLDLSWNYFSTLKSYTFQSSLWWIDSAVHHLNLSYCNIHHIQTHGFRALYKYESLSLEGNKQIASADLIQALKELEGSSLKYLMMSNMNISDPHPIFHSFQHANLEYLDLSNNVMKNIPLRTFYYLTKMKKLDLSRNRLINVGDYFGLVHLEYLILSHNDIVGLKSTSLEGLQSLESLDLSHNKLRIENDQPFSDLWDLNTLDISYNNISRFNILSGLENLQKLFINHNQLLNLDSISKLLRLKELDASENDIRQLSVDLFPKGHAPMTVNFSRNYINQLAAGLFQQTSPQVIDLSHNRLTELTRQDWNGVKVLHLQHNKLSSLNGEVMRGLTSLQELDLSYNRLVSMSQDAFSDLVTLNKLSLNSNPLGGYLESMQQKTALNSLPKVTTLQLSNVQLSRVPGHLFNDLTSLTSLDISHNNLSQVSSQDILSLRNLTFLDLSHNAFSAPKPEPFSSLVSLEVLDMSSNPYYCSCALMPFRNWLVYTKVTMRHLTDNRYICHMPMEWKGIEVTSFHLQSQKCSHSEMAVILTAISCTVLAVILTVLFGIYRYRWFKRKVRNTRYSVIEDTASLQSTTLTNGNTRVWL